MEKIKNMDEAEKVILKDNYEAYRNKLKNIWDDRLIGCYKSSITYKKLSSVRSLVFDKNEYFNFYYEQCDIYISEKKRYKCEHLI